MYKICCIEDGIYPKSSSSMVLRSACSHKHSRESSTVKEHSSSFQKRKHSKLAQNANYILKRRLHDAFEITKDDHQNIETSSLSVLCAKEISSQISVSKSPYINSSHTDYSSDYFSSSESDKYLNESFVTTSNMLNSKRQTRNSLPPVRSLSDSETENDIKVERISRLRKSMSAAVASSRSRNVLAREQINNTSLNHTYNSNSHSSMYTGTSDSDNVTHFTESSHVERSVVQYSLFDRFRWFLWSCIYLKIVGIINLDAWSLSKIGNYGKLKAVAIILTSLLLFLVYGVYRSSSPYEAFTTVTETARAAVFSLFSYVSYLFSSMYVFFTRQETEVLISKSSNENNLFYTFLTSLSSFGAATSTWFSRAIIQTKYDSKESVHHRTGKIDIIQSKEVESLTLDTLKDETEKLVNLKESNSEVASLKNELKALKSSVQQVEANKLEIYLKLQNEMEGLLSKFQSLSDSMQRLEKNFIDQKEKADVSEMTVTVTNEMDLFKDKLTIIENKIGVLEDLKNSCDKQWNQDNFAALIEKNIVLAFRAVIDDDPNSRYHFLSNWLKLKFFNHKKLMQEEINASLKQHSSYSDNIDFDKVVKVIESTVLKHVDSLKSNFLEFNSFSSSSFSQDLFSEDKIKKIVREAIMLYDADKTGLVDYALESGGGSVLGTRCSETYVEKYGKISLFGIPFWTNSNSPRTAIQPDMHPGRCWAFKGSQGFLVLQLSATIYPTGFTLEHIPVSLSPSGSIDSAPKNFSVWGLDSEKDNKGNLLGEYIYDINDEPLQYFEVKKPSNTSYSYIELQVHSNHGNMEYTCLYRFRVHGKRAE